MQETRLGPQKGEKSDLLLSVKLFNETRAWQPGRFVGHAALSDLSKA